MRDQLRRRTIPLLFILFALTGCNLLAQPTPAPPELTVVTPMPFLVTFVTEFETAAGGQIIARLGIANQETVSLPADPNFDGVWMLHNELRELLDSGEMPALPEVPAQETIYPVEFNVEQLPLGVYEIAWGAPEYGSVITTFDIIADPAGHRIGNTTDFSSPVFQMPPATPPAAYP